MGRRWPARSSSQHAGANSIGTQVLQEGFGRLVVLEGDRGVVRKTFHEGTTELRQELARAEFDRLRRFSAALVDVPGAACPRPLELLSEPPGLRMEWAPGVCLLEFLRHHAVDNRTRDRLAATMAAAVRAYVEALGEPYHDFKFDNMLYDAAGGRLTFVDLGLPQDALPPDPRASAYEITMGNFLGSVVFQTARPKYLLNRRQHRSTVMLASAVVAALARDGEAEMRPAHLVGAARAAYLRCTFGRGSVRRSAWYGTVGYALGRRMRLGEATFGPIPPWQAAREGCDA